MSAQFHALKISEVRRESADAVSIAFDVPEADAGRFAFLPGQHLTLRADINGEDVRRNYSVCVSPFDGEMRIAIKAISGGVFSNWANQSLKAGDTLEVMPPHGVFTLDFDPDNQAHYLGFAGGSGITPVLSLMKTALAVEPHSRFTLVYGNRDTNATIFLEEIQRLKNRYMGRLSLINILSDELDDIELFNGVLDEAKCTALCEIIPDLTGIRAAFICGPGPMMDAAEKVLRDHGVSAECILVERFTVDRPSGSLAAKLAVQSEKAAGTQMRVTLDGRTRMVTFDAKAGNILDSARNGGLPAPYACKAGVCATCRAKLVSGTVEMAARFGLSESDIAKGYVLTCQSIPTSDDVAVDFDQ